MNNSNRRQSQRIDLLEMMNEDDLKTGLFSKLVSSASSTHIYMKSQSEETMPSDVCAAAPRHR